MSGYSTEVIELRGAGFARPLRSAKEPTGSVIRCVCVHPGSSLGDAFVTKMSPNGPPSTRKPGLIDRAQEHVLSANRRRGDSNPRYRLCGTTIFEPHCFSSGNEHHEHMAVSLMPERAALREWSCKHH